MSKYRYENKYLCEASELRILEKNIQGIMHLDSHVKSDAYYMIRSVYFDTLNKDCFYENEDGIDPRRKFRIRIYNRSEDRILLEKKSKIHGLTNKESCTISRKICNDMLSGKQCVNYMGKNVVLDEWIIWRNTTLAKPVMLGEYRRIPYVYHLGNVRVTFDCDITSSGQTDRLFSDDVSKISVLPEGYHILEVKYDDYLPFSIHRLLDNEHLIPITFSKFYLGCKALKGFLE